MLVRQAHEIEFIKKYYNQLSPTEYSNMILEECKKDNIEFFGFVCDKWEAKNTKIILKCKFGHSWETTIASFYYAKSRCPHCNGNARKSEKERLKQIKEICIKENLTLLGVEDTNKISKKTKLTIKCDNNHAWTTTIESFVISGNRCFKCSIMKNANQRKEKTKDILRSICHEENMDFLGFDGDWIGNTTKATFVCHQGHEYKTTIASFLSKGTRCPHCNGNARKSEKERLKQIKEICIKENLTFLGFDGEWRSSSTRFNFLCHCGKTNNMTITNFVNHGARCSSCAKTGYRPIKKGTLYIQKLKGYNKLIGVKFGITNLTTQERMRNQSRVSKFDHEIFYELTLQDGQKILDLENKIKEAMKGKTSYISKEDMPDGYTETVAPSELSTIMYIVKSFEKELTA